MNTNAVVVERRLGRAVMSSSHGFWSLGGFAGGGLGGLAILHFGHLAHASLASLAAFAMALVALRHVIADDQVAPGKRRRLSLPSGSAVYLVGFIVGITALAGLVIAYMNRGKAGGFVETHYTWLIRTFWIALLFSLVSALLIVVLIGVVGMIATAVWVLVRLVKGLQALGRNEPVADPLTWWI